MSDYVSLVRRQWWIIVTAIAVCLGLAMAYNALAPREYTSTTSVLVTPTGVEPESTSSRGSTINMDTEAQIITSTQVLEAAAEALDHADDPGDLAGRLGVTVPPNTEILDLSYRGPSAASARAGAEAFAAAYLDNRRLEAEGTVQAERDSLQTRIEDLNARLDEVTEAIAGQPAGSAGRAYNEAQASSLNNQLANLGSQLNKLDGIGVTPGRVITQASLPTDPSSPQPLVNLGAGLLLGLLAGIGLAVLRYRSDPCIRTAGDVERRVGLPVLTNLTQAPIPVVADLAGPVTPAGRSYARLRNVVTANAERDSRVVLVAGVTGPAGSVAANLAASLARTGERVVLVCADVQADTELLLLGKEGTVGLAEVLAGRAPLTNALKWMPGLPDMGILGAGGDRDVALELLQTSSPRTLLATLLEQADRVVIEAPTTTSGADAQTLAGLADLAVLVVHTNTTTSKDAMDAREQFESIRTPVLGAVVLPAPRKDRDRDRATGGAGRYRHVPRRPDRAEVRSQDAGWEETGPLAGAGAGVGGLRLQREPHAPADSGG